MMSLVVTKLNGVFGLIADFFSDPTLRQLEWKLVAVLGRSLVEPGEVGERRDALAVLFVALHRAV